ncbi:MAG: hypothetical protein ABIT47_03000 [Candidatus Paceibacterota bacterium]
MTRFGWIITTAIIVLSAAVCLLVLLWTTHKPEATIVPASATSTDSVQLLDPSTLAIYTSGTYGFTFFYPATAAITDQFSPSRGSQLLWRENPIATGTLIAQVSVAEGDVRIGESQASKEVAACLKAGPAEKMLANTTLGSTTWKTFSFDKLGTDVEQHVTSYRTMHEGSCYALEAFEPRSTVGTTTQSALDSIVQSFTFAKL